MHIVTRVLGTIGEIGSLGEDWVMIWTPQSLRITIVLWDSNADKAGIRRRRL